VFVWKNDPFFGENDLFVPKNDPFFRKNVLFFRKNNLFFRKNALFFRTDDPFFGKNGQIKERQRMDWMPGRREDQLAMAKTWSTVLKTRGAEWGVTNAEISELEDLVDDVERFWAKSRANAGDRTLAAKTREAFKAMILFMRRLNQRKFFSPPMVDSDRISMNLPPRDTIRTAHFEVPETVEYELRLRKIREVVVNFWVKGASNRAKPLRYDGAVVIWDVRDAPPAGPNDLSKHTMASRTPHTLTFEEAERGKTVYIALAWQNERGIIGEWSEIQSAFIP
jgi:hypothetical protein